MVLLPEKDRVCQRKCALVSSPPLEEQGTSRICLASSLIPERGYKSPASSSHPRQERQYLILVMGDNAFWSPESFEEAFLSGHGCQRGSGERMGLSTSRLGVYSTTSLSSSCPRRYPTWLGSSWGFWSKYYYTCQARISSKWKRYGELYLTPCGI